MPNLTLNLLDKNKNKLIEKELCVILDKLSANLTAGISVQETLEQSLDLIKAPLKNELQLFLILAKKHSSIKALEHCINKTKNIFLKIFWITLLSHYKNGSALSENIKKLLKILSLRINIKERIKAQLIGVKVQVIAGIALPYVLFIVMNLLYPYLIRPVLNSELGLSIIFFALILHSIGVWFFSKIISFDTKKDLNSSMLFEYMSFSIRSGVSIKKSLMDIKDSGLLEKNVIKIIEETQTTSELISSIINDQQLENLGLILKRSYHLGISIADDLSSRSSYIMENLEQRALRFQQIVPSKALVPLFLCIFPATYLLILAPIIVEISFSVF
jgi:pilus assembly protein TadC